jgi:hypothetical protein
MRAPLLFIFGVAACAPAFDVRTAVSPDANLNALHTFSLLPAPRVRPGVERLPANDPMLVNSVTNRALRSALSQGFEARGYVQNDSAPDFVVAYYAAASHTLDVMAWDYGYPWRPHWWRGWDTHADRLMTEYVEGTVIVDVLDARSHELLWRGSGVAVVDDDVNLYLTDLRLTVLAILNEFPAPSPPVVAAFSTR